MVTYPSDWDVVELGTKCKVTSSKRVFEKEWTKSGVPFFRTRDIANFHSGEEQKDKLYISEETYREKVASSGEPKKGDLLVTGVGTIGLPYLVNSDDKMYFKDGNIMWLKKSDFFDSKFLYLLFSSKYIKDQILDKSGFTTVGTFTIQNAKKLNIPQPSLPEQKAIASALSDFEEHIDNLSELIEKKKGIRDGALEDLVSGRTRLDGFNGEWINVKLSDFAQINPSSALPEVFKYVDLESVKGITLMGWRVERKETAPSRAKRLAQFGDIFFQTVRPYQRNNYLFELSDEDVVFSTGYAQLRTKNDARFLFLLLRQDDFVNEVLDNCTGTSYPAINPSKLSDIKIYVPIDKNEQQAIAEVLTAMDEEIESLKIEKEKMIQIKEGAMDDLLTGRVRLKV
ncbi:restriction endonuclease subunit S [Fusobacterium ulcerans]|uniref:restriction endonuclease subunit S n=1 Tax=Fusobacterium ulcerans TaxID=861 RepID=UPI000E49C719|nr:restriction endonuclease subunit S [Fusobacterium ulcerans]RGY66027.1 restriction endonuclease subunit S [Fusobacterium ulcerans]